MSWTRRIFIRESLKGWMGLVIAPAVFAAARTFLGSRTPVPATSIDLGAVESFQPGMSKTIRFGSERVLVMRTRGGKMFAVSGTCTHMGCSIRFVPTDSELACNCHESRFSVDGENLSGPATMPLKEYKLDVLGGRLVISDSGKEANDIR